MKARSVHFKSSSLTNGLVSSFNRFPGLAEMEDAEEKMALFEPKALALVRLEMSHVVKGGSLFLITHQMHWCDFDTWHLRNVRGLCFCYHSLPSQHSQVCSHVKDNNKRTEQYEEQRRRKSKRVTL